MANYRIALLLTATHKHNKVIKHLSKQHLVIILFKSLFLILQILQKFGIVMQNLAGFLGNDDNSNYTKKTKL